MGKKEKEFEMDKDIPEKPKDPLYIQIFSTYQGIPAGLYKWSEASPILINLYKMYKKDGVMTKYPDGEGNATIRVYTEEVNK